MSKPSLEVTSIPSVALVPLCFLLCLSNRLDWQNVTFCEKRSSEAWKTYTFCSTQSTIYKPGLQTESCPSETDVKRI